VGCATFLEISFSSGFRNSKRSLGVTVGHGKFESGTNSELSVFLSESGRIAVEYRPTAEDLDARSEEELQNLIQVRADHSLRFPYLR
jgi:hypothetical protein